MNSKKYVIIDTDAGVDDSLALMLAFDCHKKGLIQILGITCVCGNVSVDKVIRNVLLTRRVCGAQDIKVFRGADKPLFGTKAFEDGFFGDDGLGNSTQFMPSIEIQIESEGAVDALIKLSQLYPKQITLLALGPLTNLALASQTDPEFFNNLAQVVCMGGLLDVLGNVGPNKEFNFFVDPESVDMVLKNSNPCPLAFCTWDMAYRHRMPWDTFLNLINLGTKKTEFIGKIYQACLTDRLYGVDAIDGLVLCDVICIIVGLFPELVVKCKEYPVSIELNGELTRGQLVVCRSRLFKPFIGSRNVMFVKQIDLNKTIDLIIKMAKNQPKIDLV